jgi:hypothetical protein
VKDCRAPDLPLQESGVDSMQMVRRRATRHLASHPAGTAPATNRIDEDGGSGSMCPDTITTLEQVSDAGAEKR